MTLMRIVCPECGAGLKSPTGFTVGHAVECPKCETTFSVEEPKEDERPAKAKKPVKAAARGSRDDDFDDEEEERPRKKKKKRRDDDDDDRGGYKNSPLRYAVLGILIVVMVVLGIMLIMKKQKERDEAKKDEEGNGNRDTPPRVVVQQPMGLGQPGGFPNPGGVVPKQGRFPNPPGKFPNRPGNFPPPQEAQQPSFNLLASGLPQPGSPEAKELTDSFTKKLIGTWEGTGPDGAKHTITYLANGRFTHDTGDKSTGGTWHSEGLVGTKGLKLNLGGGNSIKVVFEDDELLHPTGTPGETVILKKK